jgi:hypothetical protein
MNGEDKKVLCIECRKWKEEKDMQKIFQRTGLHLDKWEGICKQCWNFDDTEECE